jgi:hypothetical protein
MRTRKTNMKVQDIRTKAKELGIRPDRMNKTDLIHTIQRSEDNMEFYATDRVQHCGELDCLWRGDCLDKNRGRRMKKDPEAA